MPKEKNQPIGEVQCSHRACDLKASVFKFRTRAKEAWAQRRAGKLYSACANGHRCEDQDYLLNEATIWGAERSDSAPAEGESAPVKSGEKQASAPVQTAPARQVPAPGTAPVPERKKSNGWGYFQ